MLNNQNNKLVVVILAAGEGKRMKSEVPKVMHQVNGRPLIDYAVSVAEALHGDKKIVVVVSPKHNLVQDYIKDRAEYIVQKEQKGTGHAVDTVTPLIQGLAEDVIVLYGDMPNISFASVERLRVEHEQKENVLTFMTAKVQDFADWRISLNSYGRIVRNENGMLRKSIEYKDATEEEKKIFEVNPCIYMYHADWLFEHLKLLQPLNAQGEYYLTDLIEMAIQEGQKISTIDVDPKEVLGVNTQEDLKIFISN